MSGPSSGTDVEDIVRRPLDRGNALYFSGYVHDVEVCRLDGEVFVRSKCWATQRKAVKYSQQLVFVDAGVGNRQSTSATLQFATCIGCVAGSNGGLCSHVFAVLIVLNEEHVRLIKEPTVACTSLPPTWGPRQRNISPMPLMDVVVEKPRSQSSRKGPPSTCSLYEARGKAVRLMDTECVERVRESLARDCPMKTLLPQPSLQADSDFGPVPVGSFLSYHRRTTREATNTSAPPSTGKAIVSMPALPLPTKEQVAPSGLLWRIDLADAQELEQRTVGQATNAEWVGLHKSTLTASAFWRVGHRKADAGRLPADLFDGPSLAHIPAIQHGKKHESVAIKDYVAAMAARDQPVHVRECGIALHPCYQYIGASPDGMVFDPSVQPRFGLLEVKCPLSVYSQSLSIPQAAEQAKGFCLELRNGGVALRREHPYYWQVQGQMAVTNCSWCDFVVWLGNDLHIERIFADSVLWRGTILPALQDFYTLHALPYLVKLGRRNPAVPCESHSSSAASDDLSPPASTLDRHGTPASPSPQDPSASSLDPQGPLVASDQRDGGFSRLEMLLAYDECQSRIDGRSGSNACVVIGLSYVRDFLQSKTSRSPQYLCKVVRDGNALYDSLNTSALLSADTALDVFDLGLEYSRDVFVQPRRSKYDSLLQDFSCISQASVSGRAGGVFICTPYSFVLCSIPDVFVVFDSHAHGNHGALLAEVPLSDGAAYLEYFFAAHYAHLHFDASAPANVMGQMTFVHLA